MCGFLTSSILIDEVSNYTGVILRIACFDLNCPLFTCLDFWHRLSSISLSLFGDYSRRLKLPYETLIRTCTFIIWISRGISTFQTHVNTASLIVHTNEKWATTWQNQHIECAPSEDSDQPGHPPSLIRVFAVRMKKAWVLRYPLSAQRRLWSDWADAQADLSLRWVHTHLVCFVMSRLKYFQPKVQRR